MDNTQQVFIEQSNLTDGYVGLYEGVRVKLVGIGG